MAKRFEISVAKATTAEEAKALIATKLQKCKSFLPSGVQFSNGQILKGGFVTLVDWTSTTDGKKDGEGCYLALTFEDTKATIALSSLTKEVCAYPEPNSDDYQDIRNEGGLAEFTRALDFSMDSIEKINKWLTSAKKGVQVVLTPYYGESYGRLKKFNLINLVKVS